MTARHEITCIIPDGADADRRIDSIGGATGGQGTNGPWTLDLDRAITGIENRTYSFYTNIAGQVADVIVASRNGKKYLKTVNDGEEPNNLLSLPRCR